MPEYKEMEENQYVALQGGQYWRATKNIKERGIKKGTVLLLQSVRDIEGEAHTVIVRPHPDSYAAQAAKYRGSTPSEYRFLTQDFLASFVQEPDYKRIRNEELLRVQGKVTKLQQELAEASLNPTVMQGHVEEGVQNWAKENKLLPEAAANLPSITQPPSVIDQTLTVDKVESMKLCMAKTKVVAELQAGWIKEKVEEIRKTIEAMTPYYQEQAAAALATTEDVRTHVAKQSSIFESLDLYVGTGVEVRTLRVGKDADPEIPLTIMQAKLMMDEELSVWADIGEEFDFQQKPLFYKALLKHESLVKQIFPTERCIVCMATTERWIQYSDDPWVQVMKQELNENVFLLVRNGENIHVVHSPIESHVKSKRLFPSEKEMEDIFTEKRFNWETHDYDKSPVTFRDVQYTDKMTQFEQAAVHYKRFLILLAGLDHRLNLFGTFYNEPKGLNFMTPMFQNKYLKFIHDDDGEGMLPLENRASFDAWVGSRNAYLRAGSRVMCLWSQVMTPESAPSVVEYGGGNYNYRWKADPVKDFEVVIAKREEQAITVKAVCKRNSWRSTGKEFLAKVDLTAFLKDRGRETGFLVLDAAKAEDLDAYIHDRNSRKDFVSYIRLFKAAVNHLRAEEKQETKTRAAMRQALIEGNIATGAQAEIYIDAAVIAWRSSRKGAQLCEPKGKEFRILLDHMYTIGRADEDWKKVQALVEAQGRKPLRLVLSGTNQISIYASPLESEIDNVLFPMAWAMKIDLGKDAEGNFHIAEWSWRRLQALTAAETTLHQWAEAEAWKDRKSPLEKFEDKKRLMDRVRDFHNSNALLKSMTPSSWDFMFTQWNIIQADMNARKRNRLVQNPYYWVPYGLEYDRADNRMRILCVGSYYPERLLYQHAPDKERRDKFFKKYGERYQNSAYATGQLSRENDTCLGKMALINEPDKDGFTTFNCGKLMLDSFDLKKTKSALKKVIKEGQERQTFNDSFSKVFWFPTEEIDTTNDKPKEKK